jgi:hypothetical protein
MANPNNDISELEVDLLLLFYTFSDQYGWVDMFAAQKWAKDRLGVIIKNRPFRITQDHIEILCAHGLIPDISGLISKMKES